MNLIKELDKISIDPSISESPFIFLIFQEMHLSKHYTPIYLGHYDKIFNKVSLNRFFEGELSYDDMLMSHDLSKFQLDNQELLFPLIEMRLEEIKELDSPTYNEEKLIILKAIVDSINQYMTIPNSRKCLHKNELLTFLAITEWDYNFVTVGGWGESYIAIQFKITSIFTETSEIEIYLPYKEIQNLIEQLPNYRDNEKLKRDLEYTKSFNDNAERMFKRINHDSSWISCNK